MRIGLRGKRRGFTLAELLTALVIMGILAGLGATLRRPVTARSEAERAMRWLYGVILRSDRTGRSFTLRVPGPIEVTWNRTGEVESLEAARGCSFVRSTMKRTWSAQWGTLTPALTAEVRGPGRDRYYLIVSGQGRIRISDSPPED